MEMAALYACLPDVVRLGVYLENGLGVFFWSCGDDVAGGTRDWGVACLTTSNLIFFLPLLGVRAFDR